MTTLVVACNAQARGTGVVDVVTSFCDDLARLTLGLAGAFWHATPFS